MHEELKKALGTLRERVQAQGPLTIGDHSAAIDASRFSTLTAQERKTIFIDGGQAVLAHASNFLLSFIRVAAVAYQGVERVNQQVYEHYVVVTSGHEDKPVFYTQVLGAPHQIPVIEQDDPDLRLGRHAVDILSVGNLARKIMELSVASKIAETLSPGDVLVRDGDLEEHSEAEHPWWEKLQREAQRGVLIGGLSKTSQAVSGGESANVSLLQQGPTPPWYYPHSGIVGFVKLHEQSKHCFRLDCWQAGKTVAESLLTHAKDPIFYGYPYGLLIADRFGRVSNNEKTYLQTVFMHTANSDYPGLLAHMRSVDAHQILDGT